ICPAFLTFPTSLVTYYLMTHRPPTSPLFPYTTLFRSGSELFSATFGYRPFGWLGVEVEAGKIFGTDIKGDFYGANLVLEPFSDRSEEHTSELQSRENLVCRLLLEKKKNGEEYQ